jgi:hypothetical protein
VFNTTDPGIEFTADHHWYKLQGGDPSAFARAQGFDNEGTWNPLDLSSPHKQGPWQLNLRVAGSGTYMTLTTFAVSTPKLRLNDEGGVADYVKLGNTPGSPVWPELTPTGFVRRAGVQSGFALDIPKTWKGGWFEGVWDFEPKGLPSTSEDGNTFALTVTVEPGRYQDAFPGRITTPTTVEGRNALTTALDATHISYSVDWQICPGYASKCSAAQSTRRLIIRLLASTAALWDQYQTAGSKAALTVRPYDGSDPAHGTITGATKNNAYARALARFLDARVEGIGADELMCCSAPGSYRSMGGLYDLKGASAISYEAQLDDRTVAERASVGFDVTVHYAGGKTRAEFVTVGYEGGSTATSVAPKIRSACTGC